MQNRNQLLGREGEQIAERYLRDKGYKLLERNYRCLVGELDLIVLDRRVVVFVEVKTRSDDRFGTPLESVNRRKQKKMSKVALYYLTRYRLEGRETRFDVIGISFEGRDPIVEHVRNAFELS